MPLITEQISNLINGVSQQPPSLRLASQCEVQENGMVTIAEGLKKRPPLENVKKITPYIFMASVSFIVTPSVLIELRGDLLELMWFYPQLQNFLD